MPAVIGLEEYTDQAGIAFSSIGAKIIDSDAFGVVVAPYAFSVLPVLGGGSAIAKTLISL